MYGRPVGRPIDSILDRSLISPRTLFVLGNERLGLILRCSTALGESPYGLLLYRPGATTRAEGTLLFHPEHGLSRTTATVIVDGVRYRPDAETTRAEWADPLEEGTVKVQWIAGPVEVEERFRVEGTDLVRTVRVRPAAAQPHSALPPHNDGIKTLSVSLELALYANPLLFSTFATDTESLRAEGYEQIALSTLPAGRAFERFITVKVPESGEVEARYRRDRSENRGVRIEEEKEAIASVPVPPTSSPLAPASPPDPISRQCALSRLGLRAAVDGSGRFLASLMQYEFAWGLDAAMVASGAAMLGEDELALRVLRYTLDTLVNDEGMVAEADRFRDGELAELNGNGALLRAALDVAEWTQNFEVIESRWERIAAVAEYLLRPEFQHPSGLLVNRRDFWERTPWMGVEPGAELGHQSFAVVGLRAAAQLAERFGTEEQRVRWRDAASRIEEAMLHGPTHALVEEECLIKRRGVDGRAQRTIAPDPEWFAPDYAPYLPPHTVEHGAPLLWEPDTVTALPIIHGIVPPGSLLASNTLDRLEALWSPTGSGGYARYNPTADIDSPGAWPFATMWVAAAQLEAGRLDDAARSIRWLLDEAGPGGAWREFSGERSTPPFPPIGVIVWAWGQWGILVVRHILGARIENGTLVVAPRLAGLRHTLTIGGERLEIVVEGVERAELDGNPLAMERGEIRLPLPLGGDRTLRFG